VDDNDCNPSLSDLQQSIHQYGWSLCSPTFAFKWGLPEAGRFELQLFISRVEISELVALVKVSMDVFESN
jgi:hypothetical protein